MDTLIFVVLGILSFASYLDIKFKAVPSIILTSTIFMVLLLRPENIYFGVLGLVFGFIIKDLLNIKRLNFGVADIKILVVFGLLIANIQYFFIMIILFLIYQFVYAIIFKYGFKNEEEEIPFIPCLLAIYITLMFTGGLI
jgi:hypothetical protein